MISTHQTAVGHPFVAEGLPNSAGGPVGGPSSDPAWCATRSCDRPPGFASGQDRDSGHHSETPDLDIPEHMERWMDEQEAREAAAAIDAKCCVCRTEWADVANGEDTCHDCRRR